MLLFSGPILLNAAAGKILVYQRNGKGFVHDNLAASAAALREIATELQLEVEVSTNASVFTDANLKQFGAVVFANSNNDAFENDEQRAVFRRYMESGGGFVGIHSSTGSERNWPWFQQMQGGKFLRHSPLQPFTARVVDAAHPATAHFPRTWRWTDECYFFTNINPQIRILLTVEIGDLRDPKLATAPGQKVDGMFPLAWCQENNGSRRFYTSLGHQKEHYRDESLREHLRGGLAWVLALTHNNLSL
ncbi:MAG: ThuA domain-containing protein, partial [Limisphaerales bacterium]